MAGSGVENPRDLHLAWANRFNERNLAGMLDLAESGAVFVPQPGVVTTGDGAKAALEQFLAIGLPIRMTVRYVIEVDELALIVADWTLKGTGAEGQQVEMSSSTADVARRGVNGWKFVIDNPFGTA